MVFPWPSIMVVLPRGFLPGPPWWYSCRGFSLALRDGTTYLALFVISGWPFLVLTGRSSWSLWSFLMVPPWLFFVVSPWPFPVVPPRGISLLSLMFLLFTYLLPSLFLSVVLPYCPVMLHMNYNSIVFEMSAKVQNF
jgi:hypothetical protein